MKLLYQNDMPARMPSENCEIYSISSCIVEEFKEIYESLYQKLLTTLYMNILNLIYLHHRIY